MSVLGWLRICFLALSDSLLLATEKTSSWFPLQCALLSLTLQVIPLTFSALP